MKPSKMGKPKHRKLFLGGN